MTADQQDPEVEILTRLRSGDRDGAATATIALYGPEVYSFLVAVHKDEADADEVFSLFAEGLWKALQLFEGNASLRTFAYSIARRTSIKYRRNEARRRKRFDALPTGELSNVVADVRTRTATYLRTSVRSRISALRESLPVEDQELLMLRVDRKLPWDELVLVLRGEDEAQLSTDAKKREAARLRKRFQLLKDKLREMARAEGLLDEEG